MLVFLIDLFFSIFIRVIIVIVTLIWLYGFSCDWIYEAPYVYQHYYTYRGHLSYEGRYVYRGYYGRYGYYDLSGSKRGPLLSGKRTIFYHRYLRETKLLSVFLGKWSL
jgi:hypothetical protein